MIKGTKTLATILATAALAVEGCSTPGTNNYTGTKSPQTSVSATSQTQQNYFFDQNVTGPRTDTGVIYSVRGDEIYVLKQRHGEDKDDYQNYGHFQTFQIEEVSQGPNNTTTYEISRRGRTGVLTIDPVNKTLELGDGKGNSGTKRYQKINKDIR